METTLSEKRAPKQNRWQQPNQYISMICAFFAPCALTLPSGYSIAPALLLLIALLFLPRLISQKMTPQAYPISLSFAFFFIGYTLLVFWHRDELSTLDTPSRALLILPVFALLIKYPPSVSLLMLSFGLGGIAAGIITCYETFYLHYPRAFTLSMPIQSGDLSLLIGLISLQGHFYFRERGHQLMSIVCIIGACMGITGSILSLSRGGWFALFLVFLQIKLTYSSRPKKKIKSVILSVLLFIGLTLILNHSALWKRWQTTYLEISQYQTQQVQKSSIGIRLDLWKSYWQSFTQKPVLGWGVDNIRQAQTQQWQDGQLSDQIYHFNGHAHNQFLDILGTQGLFGLLVWLPLFLGPMWYFYHALKCKQNQRDSAINGLITVCATIIFCLTQNFLSHHSGMLFYVTNVALWASVARKFT